MPLPSPTLLYVGFGFSGLDGAIQYTTKWVVVKIRGPRVPLKGSFNGIYKGSMKGLGFRVVVKIMVPFWVPNIVRHLLFKVPKKEP